MAQKGSGSTSHGRSGNGHDDGGRALRTRDPRRVSPGVYRRRRIVAAVAAVVLLLLVAVGVVSAVAAMIGSDEPESAPLPEAAAPAPAASQEPFADFTPRPGGSPSASATATPTEGPTEECGAQLAVRASTDRESYPEGEEPVLALTLENTGEDPCTVNAGTSRMVYEVSSGADTVFDSRHCQAGSEDAERTLEPGQEESARLTWDRLRTAEGCTAAGGEARPGYYRLVVSLGERTSDPVPFVLE